MTIDVFYKRKNLNDFAKVENVRGYLVPELENVLKKIPGKSGMRFITQRKNMRVFEVDVRLISDSEDELWVKKRKLINALKSDKPGPLTYRGLTYQAILDGTMNFEKNRRFGFATLKFICPDPFGYGKVKTIEVPYEKTRVTVINSGDEPAPIIVSANPSSRSRPIKITNYTTGDMIEVTPTSTDRISIDTDRHYVYKGDNSSLMKYVNIKSEFFNLIPGENKIILENMGGVKITFREKYL